MEVTSMHQPDTSQIRRALLLAAILPGSTLPLLAQTADFPLRPVRWIVPTSPGAGTDFAARTFAQLAGEAWKQTVVVDNKPGASGMIGLDALAAAAPDGYTLAFISVSQFLDATLLQKFAFDAKKDLTPISLLASTPLILVANADANINSLQQLISIAKSKPKALNYSSGGSGGITHFAMEIFLKKAGISVTHVPYKGSGPAIVDLLGGQVQLSFSTLPAVLPHVKAGKLRALAVSSDKRSPLAPEVPTFAEAGLPGVSLSTWYGLFGPANMAPELVERIASNVTAGARRPATRDKMIADGLDPILSTPAEFTRFVQAEREQWLGVARSINFKRES
jgi:tripartite-type tricarboxylate transporter receptor subunit TctC